VLLAAIAADAPSLDPQPGGTFAHSRTRGAVLQHLLQIDPYHYPKVIGDAATEVEIAA